MNARAWIDLGDLGEQEQTGLPEHTPTREGYTERERTEELLYFSLSCAKDARLAMEAMERRGQDKNPEWYYQADSRRAARDDALRYYTVMVTRGWPVSATCAAMLRWEGLP